MADQPVKKVRWADLDEDEDADWPELPEVISKHGIKVKKRAPTPPPPVYVPPHLRADKTKTRGDTK